MKFVAGHQVFFLDEYNWYCGTVVSCGPKNVKIVNSHSGTVYTKPKIKCALMSEHVAVIWEMWKGVNGRGGYRVERELYPDIRKPAHQIAYNERHNEKAYGVLA